MNKKIVLTHASMKMKSHTAWEEIVSYGRYLINYLDLRNIDVMSKDYPGLPDIDTPAYQYIVRSERYHRFVTFCSSRTEYKVLKAAQDRSSGVISVVQDLSWDNEVIPNSSIVMVPFVNLDLAMEVMIKNVRNFNPDTMQLMHSPFGAIGNLDARRANTYKLSMSRLIPGLNPDLPSYLGSFKKDRIETLLNEYPESFNFVGRATREEFESEFGSKYDIDKINVVGWVDPRLSWAVYSQSNGALLATDEMTRLGLEYNRPYDLARCDSKVILLGDYVSEFLKLYPLKNQRIDEIQLKQLSQERINAIRERDRQIYRD